MTEWWVILLYVLLAALIIGLIFREAIGTYASKFKKVDNKEQEPTDIKK